MIIYTRKMDTHLGEGGAVLYSWQSEDGPIGMNDLIGQTLSLHFNGDIYCILCGKKIKKTFQGSCYECFQRAPENSDCVIRPEVCRAHEGVGRDPSWEEEHHNKLHYVYLALSSAVKVGVTRATQIPTRWIDQGASEGLILAEFPYRRRAGDLEVHLKDHYTDRTNWQKMLKNQICSQSLVQEKERLRLILRDGPFASCLTSHQVPKVLHYPVLEYPQRVKSLKFDRSPLVEGCLVGIKGQYLLFQGGGVLNVRAHSGYCLRLVFNI